MSALALMFAASGARSGVVESAPREVPRIIIPGAGFDQAGSAPGLISLPFAPTISVAPAPSIVVPAAPVILAPAPVIIVAARALTPEENDPAKPLSHHDLKRLAESLAPSRDGAEPQAAGQANALDSAFDGKLAPEASAWSGVSEQFSAGPLAPGLPVVKTAALSLIARLLPAFYRRVPTLSAYDTSEHPATGHTWTPEKGHLIELAAARPDSSGGVPSEFGAPGQIRVQQKIEHLMEYAHEYFHVLFDFAVRPKENHPAHSVYSAMTEGFAVAGEQLLAARMLDMAPGLGLGPRDAMDLAAISRARREWLDVADNHYSEGIISWRKAYAEGGAKGVLAFMASLSARRMSSIPRSDPAYQLALGDPTLLAEYLGREPAAPARRGLDAFAKAAAGEKLSEAESLDAAAAVERAGPDGWRRLFDRTLLSDKRIKEPAKDSEAGAWYEKKEAPMASVEPVFALARLSPAAGAALSRYLASTISEKGGAPRLFERAGPNGKLTAILAGAESLPWSAADRKAWDDGLMRWLIGG
jgi:hypothetical protein